MKQFRPKQLNTFGISHIFLPLFIIVALAVVGTFILVSKQANISDSVLGVNRVLSVDSSSATNASAAKVKCNSLEYQDGIYCKCKPGYKRPAGSKPGERSCERIIKCNSLEQADGIYCKCKPGYKRPDGSQPGERSCVSKMVDCNSMETHVRPSDGKRTYYCYCKSGYKRPTGSKPSERSCERVCASAEEKYKDYRAEWKVISGKCRAVCNEKEVRKNADSSFCKCKEGYVRHGVRGCKIEKMGPYRAKSCYEDANKHVACFSVDAYTKLTAVPMRPPARLEDKARTAIGKQWSGLCENGKSIKFVYYGRGDFRKKGSYISQKAFDDPVGGQSIDGFVPGDNTDYKWATYVPDAQAYANEPGQGAYCYIYVNSDYMSQVRGVKYKGKNLYYNFFTPVNFCSVMVHEGGHLHGWQAVGAGYNGKEKWHSNNTSSIMYGGFSVPVTKAVAECAK